MKSTHKKRRIIMKKHRLFGSDKPSRRIESRFESFSFDPEKQIAVIRSSICTGEKVAGFKDKKDGHFTEIMLIRSPKDIESFKAQYNLSSVKTEY